MPNIKQTSRQSKSKKKGGARSARSARSAQDAPDVFVRARSRLDKKKQERKLKTHWAHFWNVCPKCGGDMFEQNSQDIRYEVCRDCNGVYVDHEEATLVSKHLDVKKWLQAVLRRAKKPKTF